MKKSRNYNAIKFNPVDRNWPKHFLQSFLCLSLAMLGDPQTLQFPDAVQQVQAVCKECQPWTLCQFSRAGWKCIEIQPHKARNQIPDQWLGGKTLLLFFIIFATPAVTKPQFEFIDNWVDSILRKTICNMGTNEQTSFIITLTLIDSIKPLHLNWWSLEKSYF